MSVVAQSERDLRGFGRSEITIRDAVDPSVRPLYIGDRLRYSCLTSVQFLSDNRLACGSFNGCRVDLLSLGPDSGLQRLHSLPATCERGSTPNDLLAASPSGEFFATSNFMDGTCTLYTHDGARITRVGDIPFRMKTQVHGVRFYGEKVIAVTACGGPTGVHLFDVETGARVFHVPVPRKCQEVVFASDSRMLVLTVTGNPTHRPYPIYDAEIWAVDFDLRSGKYQGKRVRHFLKSHFDAAVVEGDRLYIADQYNSRIRVLDVRTFEDLGSLDGYDFPHGLDLRGGLIAVTDYGASRLIVEPLPH